ncbi:MAG: DUF2079 domain-containing protein [Thermoplasmata archaeon]|nr:DUF2079 domain-containing protein [Thermoplasmata archaeon]
MWFPKRIYLFIKTNYGVCLISLFLLLLFLINRNLFIINPWAATIDPWLYTGYFLNFEEYYKIFGVLYYGTRLSWIIPGYLLYKIFPTLIANYILHFGFIAAAVLSLYYILKRTISDRSAIFTALLFAGYVYFLNEMGWDYISCPAITFSLLTLLSLTLSTQSRQWKYHLFIAGIFCTSMIYANVFMIVFIPTIIAFLFFIYPDRIRRLFYLISGTFVGSIIMELFTYILTGNTLVILNQVNVARYLSNIPNSYWIPVETWIWNAPWLLLPLIIVIGCIVFLVFQQFNTGNKNKYSYNLFLVLNFLVTVLIFIGFQLKGNPIFQFTYYACYLIPPMFLAIAAICSELLDSLTTRQFYFILCTELYLLLIPYTSLSTTIRSEILQFGINRFFLIFVICWIAFLLFSVISRKVKIKGLFVLISLLVIISMCSFNCVLYAVPKLQRYPDNYENGFISIINSVQILNDEINGQNFRFWCNANESEDKGYYGGIFNNINALYLWGYTSIGWDFPRIDKKKIDPILKLLTTTKIMVLSTKPNAFSLASESLNEIGYNAIWVSEKNVNQGKVNFNITIITINRIKKLPEDISVNQFIPLILMNLTFLNEFQSNCYAGKCYEISVNGSVLFTPKSNPDHIASKYFTLSNISSDSTDIITKIVYNTEEEFMNDLRISIQNKNYQIISDNLNEYIISNVSKDTFSLYNTFSLSQNNESIRLLIQGQPNKIYLLPKEITLYDDRRNWV